MEKTSYLFILFLLLVGGCENHTLDISEDKPEAIDGMIFVQGGMATLGSNDPEFKASERPAMKVKLDYDFYLAIHELTCGEYRALAKEQKLKDFGKCENDSLPLANVTYYDAVLYANAKSKSENRDTSYTYSKATYDSEGHCTYLDAFVFHSEIKAYRLPTEAEWVLAASKGWNPAKFSWNANNSEYRAHDVCSAGADAFGFCDLAGNVKEWVNDWAGHFQDTTVTNYVGSLDGGDLGERVLKGGFYSEKPSEMNTVARGDDYTVEASTRAERIGFRLAFGQIPSPTWLDASGHAKASIITPLAGATSLKSYTGTYNMVLAFRNDLSGNLAYIDYNDGNLSVVEIQDSLDAYHPDISPDGKRVAFCTKYEGISSNSALYVRDLDAKGSNLVKLNVKSAAIPRWRVLDNGDTVIVYVTDAGNNKDESAFKGSATWQVKFSKGKFGTPQKLFDGAYHGGISEDNTLAVSGARLLRARIAKSGSTITEKARDTIWYDKEQACNVSLAQDKSKRTLFLDFGGKKGQKFVGKSYATHELIFIADSNGKLIQSISSPSGYTFDHTEWATDGNTSNIVATLTNANGAHTKIVLASPKDSSIVELVEGEELWHPNLWVERKARNTQTDETGIDFELDPDSAGMYYNNSGANDHAHQWRYKMEFLWQYKDTADIAIIGSSHTYYGVDARLFSSPHFAVNFAVATNSNSGAYYHFTNYILPHLKKLKIVIHSIDIGLWSSTHKNIFERAYKSYPGYVYDINHNFWKNSVPKNLFNLTYDSPGNSSAAKSLRPTRGSYAARSDSWGSENPSVNDSGWIDSKATNYRTNFNQVEEMISLCQERDIIFIGVITPQTPHLKNTGAFSVHGIRRSEAPSLIQEIANLHDKHPNFFLLDENKMGEHDYTDEMAYDKDHLSQAGAEKLTHRLDSLIKTLDIKFENKKEK
jgi:uncharacterized protein (TIGR02171 family)